MLPETMTAIAITAPGGPDMLVPQSRPVPRPGPGEIVIRVAAAGVNAPDLGQRRGTYPPPPDASPLPGLEVGGSVAAVGAEVSGFVPGDSVAALCNGGGYAEYVAVPAGQALRLPQGWSEAAAAALPETFFTVTQTLVMRAGLPAGHWVLVHGASGGIGGAAILISRMLGARPIGLVSGTEKANYALGLGAEAVIDRNAEDFVTRVAALTDGHGADRIVDIVGGDVLDRNIDAAARYGHIVLVSTQGGGKAAINASRLMMKQLTLSGSTLRPQPRETKAEIARVLGERIWPGLARGQCPLPRIRAVPLERAAAAHQAMESGTSYGKLILLTAYGAAELAAKPDKAIESL